MSKVSLFSKEQIQKELQSYQQTKQSSSRAQKHAPIEDFNYQIVYLKFRKAVSERIIENHQNSLFQQDLLHTLSHYFAENPLLTYQRFLEIKEVVPEKIQKYFTAKVFLYLCPSVDNSSISSMELLNYMVQSMEVEQQLLKLLSYSSLNEDILTITTEQLQEFIVQEFIPLIDPTEEMDKSFHEFYACQASHKFSYYLDPRRTNLINVRKLVHSSIMREMLSLIRLQRLLQEKGGIIEGNDPIGETLSSPQRRDVEGLINQINENWFSVNKSINLYTIFLNLDLDQNGLLSLDEIASFQGFHKDPIQLTRVAWKRIFEELIGFSTFELDYGGFIQLVLLLDDLQAVPYNHQLIVDQQFHVVHHYHHNRQSQPRSSSPPRVVSNSNLSPTHPYFQLNNGYLALKFFWKLLVDCNPTSSSSTTSPTSSRLTPMKVKYFYDDLVQDLRSQFSIELPEFSVFLFEFYDLMNYSSLVCDIDRMNAENLGPSFEDILASNQCKLMLLMLLDIQTYWRYENREYLIANQVNESNSNSNSQNDIPSNETNEKTTVPPHETKMTNYHYYNDDKYDEDSFYSDDGEDQGQSKNKKMKDSQKKGLEVDEDEEEEVDQLHETDMRMKYRQYNRSTFDAVKSSLHLKDILVAGDLDLGSLSGGKLVGGVEEDDCYDF